MMSNLIFQVCVGPNPPAFYETCIASAKQYADHIGADHIVLREPELKIRPLNSYRSEAAVEWLGYLPIFEKENAFGYLDEYDKICIIDSDIYIRDNAPNIFDEISDDIAFSGVYEKDMPLTDDYQKKIIAYSKGQYGTLQNSNMESGSFGFAFYNMGLMLFTKELKSYLNGQTPEQFLRRKEFEDMINGKGNWRWSTDQSLLNFWVHSSGMKRKALNWKWNALFKGVRDEKLKDSYFIHFFLSNNLPHKGNEIPEIIANLDIATGIKSHK
jgi:hypothetical protein